MRRFLRVKIADQQTLDVLFLSCIFCFQQKIGAFNAPRKDGPEKMFILLFF